MRRRVTRCDREVWAIYTSFMIAACSSDHGASSGNRPVQPDGSAEGSGGRVSVDASGSTGGSVGASGATGGGGGSAGSRGGSDAAAGAGGTAGGASDIPGGGTILFEEKFDDASFDTRGWYDGSTGTIDATEHAPGSSSSFECAFVVGGTACASGKPSRHLITLTDTIYLSFWIKFGANWVGSGKAYHPHMFHFISDLDDDYVGPASTYLTTYTEVVGGKAMLALQDSKNVDLACLTRNDGSVVGCNGALANYTFTESRSVCACNGIVGDLDGRDCFPNGDGTWYSSRSWSSPGAFVDAAGPNYKADWHFVEVYFAMNSIAGGVGVADGKIRWVQDGQTLIRYDKILLRTGTHPTLRFKQFAVLPYIGDGSPIAQSFWVDDLTVATAKP